MEGCKSFEGRGLQQRSGLARRFRSPCSRSPLPGQAMQACHGEVWFPWAADWGGIEPRTSQTMESVWHPVGQQRQRWACGSLWSVCGVVKFQRWWSGCGCQMFEWTWGSSQSRSASRCWVEGVQEVAPHPVWRRFSDRSSSEFARIEEVGLGASESWQHTTVDLQYGVRQCAWVLCAVQNRSAEISCGAVKQDTRRWHDCVWHRDWPW